MVISDVSIGRRVFFFFFFFIKNGISYIYYIRTTLYLHSPHLLYTRMVLFIVTLSINSSVWLKMNLWSNCNRLMFITFSVWLSLSHSLFLSASHMSMWMSPTSAHIIYALFSQLYEYLCLCICTHSFVQCKTESVNFTKRRKRTKKKKPMGMHLR